MFCQEKLRRTYKIILNFVFKNGYFANQIENINQKYRPNRLIFHILSEMKIFLLNLYQTIEEIEKM